MVSKKSVMNSAKITGISATVSASARFDGARASPIVEKSPTVGMSTTPSGPFSTPKTSPSAAAANTPRTIAPRMRRATSTMATPMPPSAMSGGPAVRSPSAIPVAGSLTTMPPSRSPTSVMKSPMPTPMASFSDSGTARMIASRKPATTSTSASTPSITTTDMPTGHGSFRPMMTSKATTALMPRPGASASGRLVATAIPSVAIAAAAAVATATARKGIPAADRIAGLTNTM
jgi:hypothetical protein